MLENTYNTYRIMDLRTKIQEIGELNCMEHIVWIGEKWKEYNLETQMNDTSVYQVHFGHYLGDKIREEGKLISPTSAPVETDPTGQERLNTTNQEYPDISGTNLPNLTETTEHKRAQIKMKKKRRQNRLNKRFEHLTHTIIDIKRLAKSQLNNKHRENRQRRDKTKLTENITYYTALMRQQSALNRTIVAFTNMCGQTAKGSPTGDYSKLITLLHEVVMGTIHVLGINEHKISRTNDKEIQVLIRRLGLKYICTNTDEKASRGSMLVWNPKTLGRFQVTRCTNDGPNKRIAYLQLTAGKGIKINITCSYMEDINLEDTKQNQFYKYLKGKMPEAEDTKSLYIDGGDKNCTITTQQRIPTRAREPNDRLLKFMRENQLRETITSTHGHKTTPIYTRVRNSAKAKLDHILANAAAYEAMAETGWIEQNPFIDSDHGIVWVALNNDKIGALKLRNEDNKRSEAQGIQDRIRNKNAYEYTHGSYTGVPLRLRSAYHQKLPKLQKGRERVRLQELQQILEQNGYDKTSVQYQSTHKQRIIEDLLRNDVGEENIHEFTLSDGIKWRNDKN